MHASYLEIYNEDVRDLLGKDPKQKLELKEHPEKGVYIQGRCRGSTSRVGVGGQHPGRWGGSTFKVGVGVYNQDMYQGSTSRVDVHVLLLLYPGLVFGFV